jgi:uncharacterized protein (DUF1810 family)
MPDDPYDLARFVEAQDAGGTYAQALKELHDGRKVSHWMWFVFPQIAGLGRSPMAQRYGIGSKDEARSYLRHDVLGPRLRESSSAVLAHGGRSADQIFGGIDAIKLRSSMTLFSAVSTGEAASERVSAALVFDEVLRVFFQGEHDESTLQLLGHMAD